MAEGEKGSFRDIRVRRAHSSRKPGFAWPHLPCVLVQQFNFSLSLPRHIKPTVSEAHDFAGEVDPLISPSTKDASGEFGEGSAESDKDNSESRGREDMRAF